MPTHRRFKAPSRNGEVLADPDFAAIPEAIEDNRRKLDRSDAILAGHRLAELRSLARVEALQIARGRGGAALPPSAPLLIAGHQPELSHPGVWIKNFVLNGLALKLDAVPLNLIVDNDTLKSASLRFPSFQSGKPETVHLEAIAFDTFLGEAPYEDRPVLSDELFRSFPERTEAVWQNWGYEPLLPRVWRSDRTIAGAFESARCACEEAWGCRNRELRVSELSQTSSFAIFAGHILGDLPRFREVYNAAIRSYRRDNGIESQSHPAPELEADEAPFWVQLGSGSRRERATSSSSIRALRPRALTLTLFARVCLGDFFIHGIGGGKYDEVTDLIIRDYFGIEPPGYQVLSATLHLPLPNFPATERSLQRAERLVRDLRWNPQNHLRESTEANPAALQLALEKKSLIENEPSERNRAGRRQWFQSLQRSTALLRNFVGEQLPDAELTLRKTRAEVEANGILQRRDYAWPLYPESTLRTFLQQFLNL